MKIKVSRPIIKILRMIKTDDKSGSLLDRVIRHLYNVENMSASEIATVLEISISSIYKALRKNTS